MQNMKLSIIIPTLEEEKILEKMLISLKELNKIDYEVIVSDGHSKDKTVEIAKKYANKVIEHDGLTRQTIAAGRNAGANIAQGDFLVFLDADVFIPEINTFFTKAISKFEKEKRLVALVPYLKTLPEYEKWSDYISLIILNSIYYFMNNILQKGSAGGEFQMFRRETFEKIGGYNKNMVVCEDIEMLMRMSKIGKTRLDTSLIVMHTSRRAHNEGWISLWRKWIFNAISNIIFKKPAVGEWNVSR